MQLEAGNIYDGKVTGITKFGAFVEIDGSVTGMVHISEVANCYVSEIKDHIKEGQMVKVKVLAIAPDGKISLSIKKAVEAPPRAPHFTQNRPTVQGQPQQRFDRPERQDRFDRREKKPATSGNPFEDMMSKFKQNSEERMSDLKKNIDNKRKSGSRRSGPK